MAQLENWPLRREPDGSVSLAAVLDQFEEEVDAYASGDKEKIKAIQEAKAAEMAAAQARVEAWARERHVTGYPGERLQRPFQSKRAAVVRQKADATLQECLRLDNRLWAVLEVARTQQNVRGYSFDGLYHLLKTRALPLVGWYAAHPKLRTTKHYDAVIRAIVELLPDDDIDLMNRGELDEDELHADYADDDED